MKTPGLHHVGLTVSDLDRSEDFYCRYFSCVPVGRNRLSGESIDRILGATGVQMLTSDLAVAGGGIVELIQYVLSDGQMPLQQAADPGLTHFALIVTDIDRLHERLVADDVPVRSPPVLLGDDGTIWASARVFYLSDPDGRTLEAIQLPDDHSGRMSPPFPR
ncbi:MAG: VOC family protein [Hyphomicrobiaceae bacterium]|nr:VOC family protein [Hyphomicrobiaceae bacterium]